MSAYQFTLDQTRVRRGDRPILTGYIQDDAGNSIGSGQLALATLGFIRWPVNSPPESVIELAGQSWSYQYPTDMMDAGFGNIYLRCFVKVPGLTAVLLADIDDTETALTFTVPDGSLPVSGWLMVEDEAMLFTRTSVNAGTVQRPRFGTTASAHLTGAVCEFAAGSITCENSERLDIYEEQISP